MIYKILKSQDALKYREIRLFSLFESPCSFSTSYEDLSDKDISFFEDELITDALQRESFVLGAFEEDNSLVGFLHFKRDSRKKARHKSYLSNLYLKPAYRRVGYGSSLVNELFKIVHNFQGLEQMHLWVLGPVEAVIRFYEKFGFECQGPIVKKDLKIGIKYLDAVYMVRYFAK